VFAVECKLFDGQVQIKFMLMFGSSTSLIYPL